VIKATVAIQPKQLQRRRPDATLLRTLCRVCADGDRIGKGGRLAHAEP